MARELSIQDMSAEQVELLPGRETLAAFKAPKPGIKIVSTNISASNQALGVLINNGGLAHQELTAYQAISFQS